MERSTKRERGALRVAARDDRRAIERAVKEMFAGQGQLVLPILSLVTEAQVHIEDALGGLNRTKSRQIGSCLNWTGCALSNEFLILVSECSN
jgi:hypothetical protein